MTVVALRIESEGTNDYTLQCQEHYYYYLLL
jgi:hypothetical protein